MIVTCPQRKSNIYITNKTVYSAVVLDLVASRNTGGIVITRMHQHRKIHFLLQYYRLRVE